MPRKRSKLLTAVKQMQALFLRADKHVARYQKKTRLACLNGCGRCCENPRIETSVSEMLPLAQHLFDSGSIVDIWQELEKNRSGSVCALYRPDPVHPGKGRCSQYAFRPLVCRLFGYTVRRRKDASAEVLTCEPIKESDPQGVKRSQELIDQGLKAPHMQEFSLRASGISPENNIILPINEAIEKAIEAVGLYQGLDNAQRHTASIPQR